MKPSLIPEQSAQLFFQPPNPTAKPRGKCQSSALAFWLAAFISLICCSLASAAGPTITGASSFDGATIGVSFSALLDPSSATATSNYTVTGAAVAGVTLQSDGQSIVLTLSPQISGTFVVTVSNVMDQALNPIAANSAVTNSVLNTLLADFQTTEAQAYNASYAGNVATIVAGGSDIWVAGDFFIYDYIQVTNDFDYRLRVRSVSNADGTGFSRSGIMVRDSLQDGGNNSQGHQVTVAVNTANTFQVLLRNVSFNSAGTQSLPPNPLPVAFGSNSWVRLQRQGNVFKTYGSSNGLSWTPIVQFDGSLVGDASFTSSVMYLGIATASHTATNTTTAVVSDLTLTPTVAVSITTNLPGTATWKAGVANSLTIGAAGNPIFYQWRSNGVDLVGATNAIYTDPVTQTNDGGVYSVKVYNAISTNISSNCTVTISTDNIKPVIFGAYSYDGVTLGVDFLKAMNPATTTNIANYTVTGTSVASATLSPDQQSVFLTLGSTLSVGSQFVVTVNNVQDVSQNTILPGSAATNNVLGLTSIDINTFQPFSVTNTGNWITISAWGADIFGTADNLVYYYLTATNNFDYQMRVRSIVSPDNQAFARSGIMARDSTSDPSSHEIGEFINFGNGITNTFQSLRRTAQAGGTTGVGGAGTPNTGGNNFPNVWVRLRRDGTVFRGYWSTNTNPTNWTLQVTYDGTNNADTPYANPIFLGIATSAHSSITNATAIVADFGTAPQMPVTITAQPATNTSVQVSNSVTFTVAATGIPILYQWRTNGTDIAGATNATYTIPAVAPSDGGWTYSVRVYNDISSQISSNAALTVRLDTNTPAITSISSYDGTMVTVYFSEKIDPVTAGNPANYTIPGTSVTGVTLLADGRSVLLTLSSTISGGFTLTASNVKNLIGGVAMVPGSQAFNTVYNSLLQLQDYNSGTTFSATYSGPTLTTVAGGADIFGTSDNCVLAYIVVTNDFDYRLRAQSVSNVSQQFARVGLMARDAGTNANAREVSMVYNYGNNPPTGQFQTLRRGTVGGTTATSGANPGTALGTNSWMRLRRVGNIFTTYSSTNGVDWTLYATTPAITMASVVNLGIVTSAHAASPTTTVAVSSDFGITPAANVPTLKVTPDGSGNVVLTWPGIYGGYQVLKTSSLTTPVWTTNTAAPPIVGGFYQVTVPITGSAQYFRLTMPQF